MNSEHLRTVPLLVMTCERNASYLPFVLDITRRHWPGHPEITLATDGGNLSGMSTQVVTISNATWVEVLLGALKDLKARARSLYVFVLLEDLCPLHQCNKHVIELAFMALQRSDAGVIQFSCFDLPLDSGAEAGGHWVPYDWSRNSTVNCDTFRIYTFPRDFSHYFSLQPGIWRVEYLISACEIALSRGQTTPWAFEELRWEAARPHFVSNYMWPSTHHGFMLHGKPNPGAIAAMNVSVCGALRKQLIADAFGGPYKYLAWRTANRLRKITLQGIARRLLLAKSTR
jgi:hypothetical protein